jgi:hypothetical protein
MFANYDYSNFPEVNVLFNGEPNNNYDFQLFLDQWLQLYKDKREFTFIFNMKDISYANPIYCYKLANFISKLKQRDIQYLQSTTFINMNLLMNKLLEFIFFIQTPVSRVIIKYNDGYTKEIYP